MNQTISEWELCVRACVGLWWYWDIGWKRPYFTNKGIVILTFKDDGFASQLKGEYRTFLVVQWLRVRLPMQGAGVRALVREDPTCHRAAEPVRHNC